MLDEDHLTATALLEAVWGASGQAAPARRWVRLDGARESADAVLEIARAAAGSLRC